MNEDAIISCKPTPWFLFRGAIMFLMFTVFAVLFYLDGSTGYRKKNVNYYLHQTFESANKKFTEMSADGSLNAEKWKSFAAQQSVSFPQDVSILPASLKLPMPWPPVLQDYEKMKPLQWNILWREYSKENGYDVTPPEHPYDAGKIREQWIVFVICVTLSAIAAFFLIRTMRRSISIDGEAVTDQRGKRVPFTEMKTLDLRKWDTKGLAFIDYEGTSGAGKIRLDGLTYGGFKKENGEPAEKLLQRIRSRFSGEIIEYTSTSPDEAEDKPSESA
ncbi:MAG: hypothetical protein HC845_05370 [Akkermansiaceae bacterium]|nr:hypothetical protein [Akkermansiaceae bacterium]